MWLISVQQNPDDSTPCSFQPQRAALEYNFLPFSSNALMVCLKMEPVVSQHRFFRCVQLFLPRINQILNSRDVRDEKAARKYKSDEPRYRKLHQRRLPSLFIRIWLSDASLLVNPLVHVQQKISCDTMTRLFAAVTSSAKGSEFITVVNVARRVLIRLNMEKHHSKITANL